MMGTACDPNPTTFSIGATRVDGDIAIIFVPCPGEDVTHLVVYATEDGFVTPTEDTALWELDAPAGLPVPGEIVLGQVPHGFRELMRYDAATARRLAVVITTSEGVEAQLVFRPEKVLEDWVYNEGGLVPPSDFRARQGRCR